MIFGHFMTSVHESNAFVLACDKTKDAILIDVGAFEPAIAAFIEREGLRLTKIFITHDHYDHTGGLPDVLERCDAEVLAGSSSAGGHNARRLSHGDEVRVGALVGKALATPGHTSESLSLAFPGMVFTGDALFAGSVGGTSSPSAARQQIDALRRHILTLPPETEIHTGHGPSSTVAVESRYNPFFV